MNPEDDQTEFAGTGPLLIVERFPEEGLAWRRLFQESLSFQSLCNAYLECCAALGDRQQSTAEEAPVWGAEYTQLLMELEQEVRQYLENQAALSTGPRKSA
jgi:hypothetical protein